MREPDVVRRWGAAVLPVLLLAAALAFAPESARATPTPGLSLVDDQVIGGDPRLHELTLQSAALGRTAKARILLPAGYDDPANAATRYPMLLLLHGVGDDQTSWTKRTDITAFTAPTPLIVVMPEGGKSPNSGWYSDWVNGPAWESFHIRELLPFIDANYRTIGTRAGRLVAGLSMGGFGSMSYAARHPELFVASASFSGAVDTTYGGDGEATFLDLLQPYSGTPNENVWGPYATDETRWRTHNPTDLASNLRWTVLWLATGNGVALPGDKTTAAPLEAGVYTMNLSFHGRLDELGIAHTWRDIGHGVHDWPYWQADFHEWLPHALDTLAAPPPPPVAFDYRSAEPAFEAWGWTFQTDRPGLQFVDLTGVSASGFTVAGSGPLALETPALYSPNETLRVSADDGSSVEAVTDADGRLLLTVDLGPGQATPPSPAGGVQVQPAATDTRVRRTVTIERPSPLGEGADAATNGSTSTLPATGGTATFMILAGALFATALASRSIRRRV